MNTKHIFLTMKAIVLMLTLMALVVLLIAPTAAQGDDPIQVVQTYYEAIANKDLDTIATLLADDVLATYPGGKIQGKDAVLSVLKGWIADGYRSENSNYRERKGEVRFDYIVYFGDEQVDQNTNGLTIVKDGKIIFDGLDQDKPLENIPAFGSTLRDPITIVRNFYDALANQDLDAAGVLLADDVLITYPGGKIQGKDAVLANWKAAFIDGIGFEVYNYRESNGEVRSDFKVYFGGELVDQSTDGLTIVKNGKIVFDGIEQDKPQGDIAPLVGTWKVKVVEGTSDEFDALHTYHADGTFVETSSHLGQGLEGPAHGVWQRTPDGYSLAFELFNFDEKGQYNGMARVPCLIQLDDPDHLSARCGIASLDVTGKVTESEPPGPDVTFTSTRLKVEPVLDPIAILQSHYQAFNAGQLDEAMSFVADDAVFNYPDGRYVGEAEIRAMYQSGINDGVTTELGNISDTNGRLVSEYKVFVNDEEVISGTGLTIVKDGKIIFDGTEDTWTAECKGDAAQAFCAEK